MKLTSNQNPSSKRRKTRTNPWEIPDTGDERESWAPRPPLGQRDERVPSASHSSSRRASDATQNREEPLLTPDSSRMRALQAAHAREPRPTNATAQPLYLNGTRADKDFTVSSRAESEELPSGSPRKRKRKHSDHTDEAQIVQGGKGW